MEEAGKWIQANVATFDEVGSCLTNKYVADPMDESTIFPPGLIDGASERRSCSSGFGYWKNSEAGGTRRVCGAVKYQAVDKCMYDPIATA